MKDRGTMKVLMEGGTKNGLYTFPLHKPGSSIPHYAFVCESSSMISDILDLGMSMRKQLHL